ncbi:MAG TPA: hypothetical protein VKZ53_24985 [Candidatus Angelobacter sp.]|nr:hypothetical protein [Candidatus Angelobacter sp.]
MTAMLKSKSGGKGAFSGWKGRAWLLAGIVLFVGAVQFVYLKWLYTIFGYFGFEYDTAPLPYLTLAWVLSVLPGFWMPIRLTRPSQLIYWVMYTTVYVPSMFIPLYMRSNRLDEIFLLMMTVFAGLVLLGLGYLFPLKKFAPVILSRSGFWTGVTALAIALSLWVLVFFRGNLHIVSFSQVYDLRFANSEMVVAKGSSVNYALTWLSGALGPFLLAIGLVRKKRTIVLSGALLQVLVYSASAAKSAALSLVVIPFFYWVMKKGGENFGLKFGWANTALLIGLCLLGIIPENPLINIALALVFLRIYGNSGLMTGQYYYFFQNNPLTYYSHVKGVNWFVHYPYSSTVAQQIGFYYTGDPTYDPNAHFWATDGIAALGLPGILLISAFAALVFWLLDSVAIRHELRFTVPLISFAALNIANLSIFTSLLTGGLSILMLFLYVMPLEEDVGGSRKPLVSAIAPSPPAS